MTVLLSQFLVLKLLVSVVSNSNDLFSDLIWEFNGCLFKQRLPFFLLEKRVSMYSSTQLFQVAVKIINVLTILSVYL